MRGQSVAKLYFAYHQANIKINITKVDWEHERLQVIPDTQAMVWLRYLGDLD